MKGKYSKKKSAAIAAEPMEVDEPAESADVPPPTAEELLRMAGLNTESAEALSDFEDEPTADKTEVVAAKGTEEVATSSAPKVDDEKAKAEALRKERLVPKCCSRFVTYWLSVVWTLPKTTFSLSKQPVKPSLKIWFGESRLSSAHCK